MSAWFRRPALLSLAGRSPLTLIEQVRTVNTERKIAIANRIIQAADGDLHGKTIGILGATFKPNTDDMRDAPSLVILPKLIADGAKVQAYDPHARKNCEALIAGVRWCDSELDAAQGCDVLVVLTEWNEFRALDLFRAASLMRGTKLVDMRNVFQPGEALAAGLSHLGVGRHSTSFVGLTDPMVNERIDVQMRV